MRISTRSITIALAGLTAVCLVPIYQVRAWLWTYYTDFDVYYRAAVRLANREWTSLYSIAIDGGTPFRYTPLTLPLFRPLAWLPSQYAELVWVAFQALALATGFYFLYRAVRRTGHDALWITAGSFLFVVRFVIDCFMSGQVSPLNFLGLSAGLFFWMKRRPYWAGAALLLPASLKLGPGFLFFLLLTGQKGFGRRALISAASLTAATVVAIHIWQGQGLGGTLGLWDAWWTTAVTDSAIFDGSHYGSQSLRSVLLRLAKHGWLAGGWVDPLWSAAAALGCASIAVLWLTRSPRTARARGLLFGLGVFPYLWFMPESFKNSLVQLALPFAFLCAGALSRLERVALGIAVLVLTVPGKDVVGDPIFFFLQENNFPFVITLVLAAICVRRLWAETGWAEIFALRWDPRTAGVPKTPWEAPPRVDARRAASFWVPVSGHDASSGFYREAVAQLLADARELLAERGENRSEILAIPHGHWSPEDRSWIQRELPKQRAELVLPERGWESLPLERGDALELALLSSDGQKIFIGNPDQPCAPEFFERAWDLLDESDVVRGNRRLQEGRFRVPVRVLPWAYRQHRLGSAFNAVARRLLGLSSTDTQSGLLALRRERAIELFALSSLPGFLWDLEAALIARARGFRETELPVELRLEYRKRPYRLGLEFLAIATGLPVLTWRRVRGFYRPAPMPEAITSDDWGISPAVNEGILDLARLGVVKRVSVLVTARYAEHRLRDLQQIPGVSLGLHWDLTHSQVAGQRRNASEWLKTWLRGRTPELEAAVLGALRDQLGRLRAIGVSPEYLDGHHHVHALPGLLTRAAPILREFGIREVRSPADPRLLWSSRAPIWALGVLARLACAKLGFKTRSFYYPGVPEFSDFHRLRSTCSRKVSHEIICHPASREDFKEVGETDPYTSGRVAEYRALRMLAAVCPSAIRPASPEAPTPRASLSHSATLGLLLALAIGAALRFIWVGDMEYKEDEEWMFLASQAARWPWLGIPSGVYLENPGLSVWVFKILAWISRATEPTQLARTVQALNVLALAGAALWAVRANCPKPNFEPQDAATPSVSCVLDNLRALDRSAWLWGVALVCVNPLAVAYHRKIWAQSVLPFFTLLLIVAWGWRSSRRGSFAWGALGTLLGQVHMSGFFLPRLSPSTL